MAYHQKVQTAVHGKPRGVFRIACEEPDGSKQPVPKQRTKMGYNQTSVTQHSTKQQQCKVRKTRPLI